MRAHAGCHALGDEKRPVRNSRVKTPHRGARFVRRPERPQAAKHTTRDETFIDIAGVATSRRQRRVQRCGDELVNRDVTFSEGFIV